MHCVLVHIFVRFKINSFKISNETGAEWEFGGFPGYLLNIEPEIKIRTFESGYIGAVDSWWSTLLPQLRPLLYSQGGPIVMVQIENEFGSFGDVSTNLNDKLYMEHLLDVAHEYLGSDEEVIYYSTDGGDVSYMKRGTLPGKLLTTGDFGPGYFTFISFLFYSFLFILSIL